MMKLCVAVLQTHLGLGAEGHSQGSCTSWSLVFLIGLLTGSLNLVITFSEKQHIGLILNVVLSVVCCKPDYKRRTVATPLAVAVPQSMTGQKIGCVGVRGKDRERRRVVEGGVHVEVRPSLSSLYTLCFGWQKKDKVCAEEAPSLLTASLSPFVFL